MSICPIICEANFDHLVKVVPPRSLHCTGSVVGRILAPMTFSPCECVILRGKKDFANIIKVTNPKQGDCLGLPQWAQCNHRSP